jgi:hypothetical protein
MFIICSMNRERTSHKPLEAETPPVGGVAPEGGLEQAIQDELSEMRAITLRFARRLDARADTDEGRKELTQLSNAAVRSARSFRQVAVLQLEIAGKRPLANSGANGGAGANAGGKQAAADKAKSQATNPSRWYPKGYPFARGDYTDYDDYTDEERKMLEQAKFGERIRLMEAAVDEDFRAAGREDICREAPITKFELVFGIPHPALDRCFAEVEPGDVYRIFGLKNVLPPRLGAGPPGVLEEYDAKYGHYPKSSS